MGDASLHGLDGKNAFPADIFISRVTQCDRRIHSLRRTKESGRGSEQRSAHSAFRETGPTEENVNVVSLTFRRRQCPQSEIVNAINTEIAPHLTSVSYPWLLLL